MLFFSFIKGNLPYKQGIAGSNLLPRKSIYFQSNIFI